MAIIFENETCGRCAGTGKFSYNQIDGNRCYGCQGSGVKLTKRGAAAKAFFIESQQTPVADLKPGMFVWDDMLGKAAKFLPLLAIEQSGSYQPIKDGRCYYVSLKTSRCINLVFPDSKVRAVRDEEHRQQLIQAALAFQSTLTKTGKPRK
jgi:hypothetical protein